nr:hypothetical protein [Parabacteroides goldsteinii]
MKNKVLRFIGLACSGFEGLEVKEALQASERYPVSTGFLQGIFLKKTENRSVSPFRLSVLFLFMSLFLSLKAQSGFTGRFQIRVNDPAVDVTVDKPRATSGETVTITLTGMSTGQTASVKAGTTYGDNSLSPTPGANNAYTFTMPDYTVYIDVDIQQSAPGGDASYEIVVATPGVAEGRVRVTVSGEGVSGDASGNYLAKAGKEVTVTLQTPLADRLSLTKTEAYASDGSWRWVDLSGGIAVPTLTFTMPAAPVIVSFSIHEAPPVDPDRPDYPDYPYYPETVYRLVTLPEVEGATTDPVAGDYEVENWGCFTFRLLVDKAYSRSKPVVTTSRGETLKPLADSVTYLVKYIRADLDIRIDSLRRNDATANAAPVQLPLLHVTTAGGTLFVESDRPCDMAVYTFGGQQVAGTRLSGNSRQSFTLPRGAYILRAGTQCIKFNL